MYNELAAQYYSTGDPKWTAFLTINQIKDVLFIEQCNGMMSYEGAYELFCDEKPWEEKVKEFTVLAWQNKTQTWQFLQTHAIQHANEMGFTPHPNLFLKSN